MPKESSAPVIWLFADEANGLEALGFKTIGGEESREVNGRRPFTVLVTEEVYRKLTIATLARIAGAD